MARPTILSNYREEKMSVKLKVQAEGLSKIRGAGSVSFKDRGRRDERSDGE